MRLARWLALVSVGCVGVPDPPPVTEDLSALNARYEHPTAVIPDDVVQGLVARAREALGPARVTREPRAMGLRQRQRAMCPRALTLALGAALATLTTLPAFADQKKGNERVDKTAFTLKSREFSVGLWEAQAGVMRELLVGTYLPTWFAFPILGAPIPSAFLKVRDPFKGPLTLSGRVSFL